MAQTAIELLTEMLLHFDSSIYDEAQDEGIIEGHDFFFAHKKFNDDTYSVSLVEEVGGEGEGSHYYYVFAISKTIDGISHDYLVEIDGIYDSWNGTEWLEAPYFVKPVEKTITVYEAV